MHIPRHVCLSAPDNFTIHMGISQIGHVLNNVHTHFLPIQSHGSVFQSASILTMKTIQIIDAINVLINVNSVITHNSV